jgi:hypothetical protein
MRALQIESRRVSLVARMKLFANPVFQGECDLANMQVYFRR